MYLTTAAGARPPLFLCCTYNTAVALEHRWYGQSIPGDIGSTADLKSLNVDAAIADLATFITWYDAQLNARHHLRGVSGPAALKHTWLVIGGSYPGALSSWLREMHPEIVTASWSSSGVVQAVYEFTRFDQIVGEVLPPGCADSVRAVMAAFDAAWDVPADRATMKALFGTPDYWDKFDMAWMLADSAAMGAQCESRALAEAARHRHAMHS